MMVDIPPASEWRVEGADRFYVNASDGSGALVLLHGWRPDGPGRVAWSNDFPRHLRDHILACVQDVERMRARIAELERANEFARYMATAADGLIDALSHPPDSDAMSDAFSGLKSAVYEYRKRAALHPQQGDANADPA